MQEKYWRHYDPKTRRESHIYKHENGDWHITRVIEGTKCYAWQTLHNDSRPAYGGFHKNRSDGDVYIIHPASRNALDNSERPPHYKVGEIVEVNVHPDGSPRWYVATIEAVNNNGTYNFRYRSKPPTMVYDQPIRGIRRRHKRVSLALREAERRTPINFGREMWTLCEDGVPSYITCRTDTKRALIQLSKWKHHANPREFTLSQPLLPFLELQLNEDEWVVIRPDYVERSWIIEEVKINTRGRPEYETLYRSPQWRDMMVIPDPNEPWCKAPENTKTDDCLPPTIVVSDLQMVFCRGQDSLLSIRGFSPGDKVTVHEDGGEVVSGVVQSCPTCTGTGNTKKAKREKMPCTEDVCHTCNGWGRPIRWELIRLRGGSTTRRANDTQQKPPPDQSVHIHARLASARATADTTPSATLRRLRIRVACEFRRHEPAADRAGILQRDRKRKGRTDRSVT